MSVIGRLERAFLLFGLFLIFAGDIDSPKHWERLRDHLNRLIGWDLLVYDRVRRGNEFADGLV